MSMSINTNAGAMIALQNLSDTTRKLEMTQLRVTTGLKVRGPKDDAATQANTTAAAVPERIRVIDIFLAFSSVSSDDRQRDIETASAPLASHPTIVRYGLADVELNGRRSNELKTGADEGSARHRRPIFSQTATSLGALH